MTWIKRNPVNPDWATCPSELGEDQGPQFYRAIGRPLCRHIITRVNHLIATRSEGSDYATSPAHYKIFKKLIVN